MPGLVTPTRRPREDDEGNESQEDDVPSNEAGTSRSNRHKRPRTGAVGSGREDSDDSDSPLLPDSFRRSPNGKGAAARRPSSEQSGVSGPQAYQPGSIVRVKMMDFVTYTEAEFAPGPNLNMIIGPNGTGKSTLVCAICLGLGYSPAHLGRAKSLGEFVKHGAKKAEIEIELAGDPQRHVSNPIITTRITKEGNKTKYLLDGKDAKLKDVKELTRSFQIQVDNLCQFLPQDKVVEFAAMSPVDLLTATEKAAAPAEMTEWHAQLTEWRKEQKTSETKQQNQLEILKNLEDRQRGQEADVARLRERTELKDRVVALEKFRPLAEYRVAKERHAEAKTRKKEAQRELRALERRMEPNLRAANAKEDYLASIDKIVTSRKKLVERSETHVRQNHGKIAEAEDRLQGCVQDINRESNSIKKVRQSMPKLQGDLKTIQRALENPPHAIDFAQMNEQIREKTRQSREASDKMNVARQEIGDLSEQIQQREQIVKQADREKEGLKSQAGQQANKLRTASRDAAKAWDWIQGNSDKFQGRVFGPPIIECRVKDPKLAGAVESSIPDGDKFSFTVTSKEDFDTLQRNLYGQLKLSGINIRTAGQALSNYDPPMAKEQLERYGLECWLLDLIDGPEEVLAMLCDNRSIHQTAFTTREVNQAQYEALLQTNVGSWVTPTQTYLVSRRRDLGPNATSTRVQPLRPARFFTDVPVDQQAVREIQRRIDEAEYEIGELKQSITTHKAEFEKHKEESKRSEEEKKEISSEKETKQRQQSEFNALPTKLQHAQSALDKAQEALRGSAEAKRLIIERGDQICLEKGQFALDYANSVEALRGLHLQLFETEIQKIEAKSDLQQLRAQHAEEERLLNERRQEVGELERVAAELLQAGQELQRQCAQIGEHMTDFEHEIYNEIEQWGPDQLETEVQSVRARVEMNSGRGNENTLREFEERARVIEKGREQLIAIGNRVDRLTSDIAGVREQWEPRLDALVAQISDAFAENFTRIQCAGEVAVHKDDDFEQWAIQIKVKFRETEQLSVLDSHRQSGGERAVSTIFYLMALQSLARAPFRVVDEINQGMDPRNERLVHSRMVDIACAEHTSQYFLITPKLLNGLRYHPNMKVHCIASGEHMPDDHAKLDFGVLAHKALALRAGPVGRDGQLGAVVG